MLDYTKPPNNSNVNTFRSYTDYDYYISSPNVIWINKPASVEPSDIQKAARKHRIIVDCYGFKSSSIKTELRDKQIDVIAYEEEKRSKSNFSVREFKRTFDIPSQAEVDKLVSFLTKNGLLVIEVPLKPDDQFDLLPRISDDGKSVSYKFSVPDNFDISKLRYL